MATNQAQTFGALLKRHRLASGLTQSELAEKAGLSPEAVSALERGVNRAPRKDTVALLADALALDEPDRALLAQTARRHRAAAVTAGTGPIATAGSGPAMGPGTLPPLIGREALVAEIGQWLDGSGPPALFLSGEPGVGKTRLLYEASLQAAARGWAVLSGECRRQGGQVPFAPLLSTVERYILKQAPRQQQTDVRGCAWLVRLLPELPEMGVIEAPVWTLPPEQERRLMFAAVGRFLVNISGPTGTLLILDDLQWTDSDGCDLMATLMHSAGQTASPLRVLGAYRDTEAHAASSPLATLLADLARAGLARVRAVAPLGEAASRELLACLLKGVENPVSGEGEGMTPVGVGRMSTPEVARQAGGVPFYLVSWAQALRAGALEPAHASSHPLPWDIVQSVRQRVLALPDIALEVLRVAAVSGSVTPRWVIVTILERAERREDDIIGGLENACQARLLQEVGDDTYQFAHELIREVVLRDLSLARRAALHRRLAEALEREKGETAAEALAFHFLRGGDSARAAPYLELAAGRASAMRAYAAAESQYREVIGLLDSLGRALDAARAREKLGGVLAAVVRYQEALDTFALAAETYRVAGDYAGWGRVEASLAQTYADQGTAREGLARLQPLLATTGTSPMLPPQTAAALYDMQAQLLHVAGEYSQQLEAADRAAALARDADDQPLLCQIQMRRGNALRMLGRLDEAAGVLEDVIRMAETAHDERTLAYALDNASGVYLLRGELDRTASYVERAYDLMERLGDPLMIALLALRRGMSQYGLGEWQTAFAEFLRAHALTGELGVSWVSAYTSLGLGQIYLARGEKERGADLLEQSVALAERSGDLQALRWAETALAEHDILEGRPESARARLEPLLDRPGLQEGLVTYLLPYLAWACLDSGDLQQAERYVSQSLERAAGERIRLAWVDALRVQALLRAHRGGGSAAPPAPHAARAVTAALREAAELCREMRFPYGEAKVAYTRGMLAWQEGRTQVARQALEEALGILNGLGERQYGERVERLLSELG